MAPSIEQLMVTADHAVIVEPAGGTATIVVNSGNVVYYNDNPTVDATHNIATIAVLGSVTVATPVWLKSAGLSSVTVTTADATSGASMAVSVKASPYNAKGGAKIITDAAITAAQSTVTSSQAAFTTADVGKYIYVEGAGANIAGTSPTLQSTLTAQIASVSGGVATIQAVGGGALTATTTVTSANCYFGVDDSAAFLAALQAGPVYAPADNYLLASGLTLSQSIELYGDGFGRTVLLAPAVGGYTSASHLLVRGSAAAGLAVAADVQPGASSFTTTSNPGLRTGDLIVLRDGNQTYPTWPASLNTACRGEMLRVQSVTGAGPFTVNIFGVVTDQYLFNNAATMQKLAMLSGVRIDEVEFRCTTPYTQSTNNSPMVWVEWAIDPHIKVRVRGNPGPGFSAGSCWDGDFYIDAEDLADGQFLGSSALGWYGYGAWAAGVDRDCRYFVNAKRVRHGFTASGRALSATPSVSHGCPRNITVDGFAAETTEAGFDTHADSTDIHFGRVHVHSGTGAGAGMNLKGLRNTVGDAHIDNVNLQGIVVGPLSTQNVITANGVITLGSSGPPWNATTSGQAAGTVLLTAATTAAASALPTTSGSVLTIGGVAIRYTGITPAGTAVTLTGATWQGGFVPSPATIATGSVVNVTTDAGFSIQSHATNCHIKTVHIHDIWVAGAVGGQALDLYAPHTVVDAAFLHDLNNGVRFRSTGSDPKARCDGCSVRAHVLNAVSNGFVFEGAPSNVRIAGYIEGSNSAIINTGAAAPPNLDSSDLIVAPTVSHPAADNFSAHGYGIAPIPVGRSNSRAGESTLVAGTVTVTATSVTANSIVVLTRKTAGGTLGHLSYTISAGASFTITSNSGTDTSVIQWAIVEKGAT